MSMPMASQTRATTKPATRSLDAVTSRDPLRSAAQCPAPRLEYRATIPCLPAARWAFLHPEVGMSTKFILRESHGGRITPRPDLGLYTSRKSAKGGAKRHGLPAELITPVRRARPCS